MSTYFLSFSSYFSSQNSSQNVSIESGPKFSAVCFSIAGVALVCYSDLSLEGGDIPAGALWYESD